MRKGSWTICFAVFTGLLAGSAWAAPEQLSVNCSHGKSINDAIDKVRKGSIDKDYVITVSGACTEDVNVFNIKANSLLIDGQGSATLTGTGTAPFLIFVDGSNKVVIQGFSISAEHEKVAVFFQNCIGCVLSDSEVYVHADSPAQIGVQFNTGTIGTVWNSNIEVSTTAGNVYGVNVTRGANVRVAGTTIQNTSPGGRNGTGIIVSWNSAFNAGGTNVDSFRSTTVSGFGTGVTLDTSAMALFDSAGPEGDGVIIKDNRTGITINAASLQGSVKVLNNATGSPGSGIVVEDGGQVSLGSPTEISGNSLYGILVSHGSNVVIGGGASITFNGGRGLVLASLSSARLTGSVGSNTIGENGIDGVQIACDASSVLTGTASVNLRGGSISCANSTPESLPLP